MVAVSVVAIVGVEVVFFFVASRLARTNLRCRVRYWLLEVPDITHSKGRQRLSRVSHIAKRGSEEFPSGCSVQLGFDKNLHLQTHPSCYNKKTTNVHPYSLSAVQTGSREHAHAAWHPD